ncbi:hypothetical protein [Streptomyces sp. NPDC059928]|uniref:hypothetical protein n=1 Tax=unclassified Streptomyces TaxID=2593676 RepID=UPI0036540692
MILIPINLNHAVLLTPAHTGITPYRFCTGPAVPDNMADVRDGRALVLRPSRGLP